VTSLFAGISRGFKSNPQGSQLGAYSICVSAEDREMVKEENGYYDQGVLG